MDSKLVNNVILTLIARLAIVVATGVGLPGAFWMMNRAVNSSDAISAKIDALQLQAAESTGVLRLMQQAESSDRKMLDDHEIRLRRVESVRATSRD